MWRHVAVQGQNRRFVVVFGGEWREEGGGDFEEGGGRHGRRATGVALQEQVGGTCNMHEAAGDGKGFRVLFCFRKAAFGAQSERAGTLRTRLPPLFPAQYSRAHGASTAGATCRRR
jgi:hypothetical protein